MFPDVIVDGEDLREKGVRRRIEQRLKLTSDTIGNKTAEKSV